MSRPIPTFNPDADTGQGAALANVVARSCLASLAWTVQYGLWVWVVLGWRLTVWAIKAAGALAVLIFVPVVGWLALWLVLRARKSDRQHAELVSALRGVDSYGDPLPRGSLWRPWAITWVCAPLRAGRTA